MYKHLIFAALLIGFGISAQAVATEKKAAASSIHNNKMDTNHDGVVSLKEAEEYGDRSASRSEKEKSLKTNKVKNNSRKQRSDSEYIEPLGSESEFPWSNSKKR